MYGTSTHFKYWNFKNEKELLQLRIEANKQFIDRFFQQQGIKNENKDVKFLTPKEEFLLVKFYENTLKEFCVRFRDPRDTRIRMPVNVIATALHYFKRFYLYNSVMDYHPKEILVTCVYLACKIEEFYVTINDFVYNVNGDKKKAAEIILNNELQLTQELQFHLIIHHPYRPVEGLLIDIKTRYPALQDPDRLRPIIEEFLDKVLLTDAILLYSPSPIALAAVTTAVSKVRDNLDKYVTDILFKENKDHMKVLIEGVRKIKRIVKSFDATLVSPELKNEIEEKLERCRNQENNPNSDLYSANTSEWDDDNLLSHNMDTDENFSLGVEEIRSPM